MNKSQSIDKGRRTIIPLACALFAGAALFLLSSCGKGGGESKPPDIDYYTCTMHPSVRSQDPDGKCPICGMDLVPVKKMAAQASPAEGSAMAIGSTADQPHEFTVSLDRQQMIGVTYATAENRPLRRTVRAVG